MIRPTIDRIRTVFKSTKVAGRRNLVNYQLPPARLFLYPRGADPYASPMTTS